MSRGNRVGACAYFSPPSCNNITLRPTGKSDQERGPEHASEGMVQRRASRCKLSSTGARADHLSRRSFWRFAKDPAPEEARARCPQESVPWCRAFAWAHLLSNIIPATVRSRHEQCPEKPTCFSTPVSRDPQADQQILCMFMHCRSATAFASAARLTAAGIRAHTTVHMRAARRRAKYCGRWIHQGAQIDTKPPGQTQNFLWACAFGVCVLVHV